MSTLHLSSDRYQKRASDPITDGFEPPCGCWELNSGPLEEQSVLLTAEPSPVLLPRTCYVDQAGTQRSTYLPLPPECWY